MANKNALRGKALLAVVGKTAVMIIALFSLSVLVGAIDAGWVL